MQPLLTSTQSSSSQLSSPLPTQCFFDVILVPLPTWILIVLVAIFPLIFRHPVTGRDRPVRRWLRIVLLVLYYFAIAVIVLMESVEVARFATTNLGVGLVPFVYAGCVVAGALQATGGLRGVLRGWQVAAFLFWVLSLCITTVKAAALAKFNKDGPEWRNDTAYSVDHQITDLVILVIFYAIAGILEVVLLVVRPGVQPRKGYREGGIEET